MESMEQIRDALLEIARQYDRDPEMTIDKHRDILRQVIVSLGDDGEIRTGWITFGCPTGTWIYVEQGILVENREVTTDDFVLHGTSGKQTQVRANDRMLTYDMVKRWIFESDGTLVRTETK